MGLELTTPITYTIDSNTVNSQIQEKRPEHRTLFKRRFASRSCYGPMLITDEQPWQTVPDSQYSWFAEQGATSRHVTATRIAMPRQLTEEQRLRRNAKELENYYVNREERLEKKRREGQKKPTAAQNAEKKRRFRARHPEKVAAQRRVEARVRYGKWPRVKIFKCSDCDAQAQSYHHEDYSLWWSVEPLCHKCHGRRHRKS